MLEVVISKERINNSKLCDGKSVLVCFREAPIL